MHWHDRHVILRQLLSDKRKEYLLMRANMDISKPKHGGFGNYSDDDAATLLKGNNKAVSQMLLRELHVEFDATATPPFHMFHYIPKNLILDYVHAEHEKLKTFVIVVELETIRNAIL